MKGRKDSEKLPGLPGLPKSPGLKKGSKAYSIVAVSVFLFLALAATTTNAQSGNAHSPADEITIVSLPPPIYPQMARIASIFGDVRISVKVRPDGTVESAAPMSGHPVLTQAALDSARQTLFACGRCTATESFEMLYSFQIVDGNNCCDAINVSPTSELQRPNRSDKKLLVQVIVKAPRPCICDPAVQTTFIKSRSLRCLYLWKCGKRRVDLM